MRKVRRKMTKRNVGAEGRSWDGISGGGRRGR